MKSTICSFYLLYSILGLQGQDLRGGQKPQLIKLRGSTYVLSILLCPLFNKLKLQPFWSQLVVDSASTETKMDSAFLL